MEYKIEKPKRTVYFIEKGNVVATMKFKEATDMCIMLLNDLDLEKGGCGGTPKWMRCKKWKKEV